MGSDSKLVVLVMRVGSVCTIIDWFFSFFAYFLSFFLAGGC